MGRGRGWFAHLQTSQLCLHTACPHLCPLRHFSISLGTLAHLLLLPLWFTPPSHPHPPSSHHLTLSAQLPPHLFLRLSKDICPNSGGYFLWVLGSPGGRERELASPPHDQALLNSPFHPGTPVEAGGLTLGQPQVDAPVDLQALQLLLHAPLAAAVVERALLQHLQGCLALLVGQHGVAVPAGQALPQRAVAGAAVGFGRAQLIGPDTVHRGAPAVELGALQGGRAGQRAEGLVWVVGREDKRE